MAQYSPVQPTMAQHSPAHPSTSQHGPAWPSTAQSGLPWPSTAQHGLVHPSTSQHDPAHSSTAQHSPARPSMAQHIPAQPSMAQHIPAQLVEQQQGSGAAGQAPGELPGVISPLKFLSVQFHQGHCRRCGLWLVVCLLTAFPAASVCVCNVQAFVLTAGQKLSAACDAAVISNRRHKLEQINLNQIQFLVQSPRSRCQSAPTIN